MNNGSTKIPYINSIILSGRLVNDSNIKVIPTSGKQVLEFRIARTEDIF